MPSKSNSDPHIDFTKFGKKTRSEIEAAAAREKKKAGISGNSKRIRAYVNGHFYELPIPDVRALRESLALSQIEFGKRFSLSSRTVQQWEQHRATPDMPARVLLKAIEQAPDVIARAAAEVQRELKLSGAPRK